MLRGILRRENPTYTYWSLNGWSEAWFENGFTAHRCSDAWLYNGFVHWGSERSKHLCRRYMCSTECPSSFYNPTTGLYAIQYSFQPLTAMMSRIWIHAWNNSLEIQIIYRENLKTRSNPYYWHFPTRRVIFGVGYLHGASSRIYVYKSSTDLTEVCIRPACCERHLVDCDQCCRRQAQAYAVVGDVAAVADARHSLRASLPHNVGQSSLQSVTR